MNITLDICIYILVMAGVTYLIRMTPFVLFRKKITNKFVRNVLFYLPYAVLSAMVIPSVFYSTGSVLTASAGLVTALILAYFERSLIIVALGASAAAYIAGSLINLLS